MQLLTYNTNFKSTKYGNWSIHSVAMFMMAVYIVLSSAFECVQGYGFLNSISLYAFLGVGVLNIIYKKRVVFIENYYFVSILLYFSMLTLSSFYTPMEIAAFANYMYYYRFFTVVVISFITVNLIETQEDMNYLLHAFVFSGLVMSIAFISTYGEEIFSIAEQTTDAERLGDDFGNVNVVAQRLNFSLIFTLYLLMFKVKRYKLFYLFVACSCMAIILLTGSRKALLVFVVVVVYMFYAYSKNKSFNFKLRAFVGMVVAFTIVIYAIYNIPLFASIKIRIDTTIKSLMGTANIFEGKSDSNRIWYIKQGIRYWLNKPFLGNGIGFSYYILGTYCHNNYIEILLNTGVAGFVIYYYSFAKTWWYALNRNINIEKTFKTLVLCIVFAIAVIDIGIVSYCDRYICVIMSAISSQIVSFKDTGSSQDSL